MRRVLFCLIALLMVVFICGCGTAESGGNTSSYDYKIKMQELYIEPETESFSYKEVVEEYKDFASGTIVFREGFVNKGDTPINSREDAIAFAKLDCTAEYDTIRVGYDADEKVYFVWFYIRYNEEEDYVVFGGDQQIFLSADGKTLLKILGE